MLEEEAGVMRNAMTTRAPGGANKGQVWKKVPNLCDGLGGLGQVGQGGIYREPSSIDTREQKYKERVIPWSSGSPTGKSPAFLTLVSRSMERRKQKVSS